MDTKKEIFLTPCIDHKCIHVGILRFKEKISANCMIKKEMVENCTWYKSIDDLKKETKGGI